MFNLSLFDIKELERVNSPLLMILRHPEWGIDAEENSISAKNLVKLYCAGFFFDFDEVHTLAIVSDNNHQEDIQDLYQRISTGKYDFPESVQNEAGYCLYSGRFKYFKRRIHGRKVPVARLDHSIAFLVRAFNAAGAMTISSCGHHPGSRPGIDFLGPDFNAWALYLVKELQLPIGIQSGRISLQNMSDQDLIFSAEKIYANRIELRNLRRALIDEFGEDFAVLGLKDKYLTEKANKDKYIKEFMLAVEENNSELVAELFKDKNHIYACHDGMYKAASLGYFELLKFICNTSNNKPADFNILLSCAAEYNHLEMAKWLVLQGAEVCCNNHRPLRMAANNKHQLMAQWLVSEGSIVHSVIERMGLSVS